MSGLTIACVWVEGHLPYSVEYVARLRAMSARFCHRAHEFVCLTDQPALVPAGVRPIKIPNPNPLKGWWSKLRLFSPEVGLTGRVLYLDLDTLVVDSLEAVIDYPAPFALAPHAGTFNGKGNLKVVRRFNSSVMAWDAGTTNYIWQKWHPSIADTLWGDQDMLGLVANDDAKAMPGEWFPRLSEFEWPTWPKTAKVVLVKKPKNAVAVKTLPGFAEAWG